MAKDANDVLLVGWSAADFRAALEGATAMSEKPPEAEAPRIHRRGKYTIEEGRLCRIYHDRTGNECVDPLSNFACEIEQEVMCDDGIEPLRLCTIAGRLDSGRELPRVQVPATEFATMGWVSKTWGTRAVIEAGASVRDHLRVAIQRLSKPEERTIFRHTGWRHIEGRWTFLFSGGAVGASNVAVELDAPLDRYTLPEKTVDLVDAIKATLFFLECGPPSVIIPLLGAAFLAPLSSLVQPDFTVWLYGPSGTMKSTIAGLILRHFGQYKRKLLPAHWASTANSLELRLSVLKDVLCVIDDYSPQPSPQMQRELESKAERILRAVGNRSARGRMRADLSQRPDRPPRGLVLATAEDLPVGSSILARVFAVELESGALNKNKMKAAEKVADRFGHTMRGYIEWLAKSMDALPSRLEDALIDLRASFSGAARHLRQAEAAAQLFLGYDLFLQFATESGAIDVARADEMRLDARKALVKSAVDQGDELAEIDIAEQFVESLRALFEQRSIQICEDRTAPPRYENVPPIGFLEAGRVYINQRLAKQHVHEFLRRSGEHWNPSSKALASALARKGWLAPSDEKGRLSHQMRVGNERRRYWSLPSDLVLPPAVSGFFWKKTDQETATGDKEEDLNSRKEQQISFPVSGVSGCSGFLEGEPDTSRDDP